MLAARAARTGYLRETGFLREGGGDYLPRQRPYEISPYTRARVDETHEEIALQRAMEAQRLTEEMGELQRASSEGLDGLRIITAPQLQHMRGETVQSFRPIGGFPLVMINASPAVLQMFRRGVNPAFYLGYEGGQLGHPGDRSIPRRGPGEDFHHASPPPSPGPT